MNKNAKHQTARPDPESERNTDLVAGFLRTAEFLRTSFPAGEGQADENGFPERAERAAQAICQSALRIGVEARNTVAAQGEAKPPFLLKQQTPA